MRYLKHFEDFDFNKTLMVSPASSLTNYYSCQSCPALFRSQNSVTDHCPYCEVGKLSNLDRDEWYDLVAVRLDDDEKEDWFKTKKEEEEKFINLLDLQDRRKDPRLRIN